MTIDAAKTRGERSSGGSGPQGYHASQPSGAEVIAAAAAVAAICTHQVKKCSFCDFYLCERMQRACRAQAGADLQSSSLLTVGFLLSTLITLCLYQKKPSVVALTKSY